MRGNIRPFVPSIAVALVCVCFHVSGIRFAYADGSDLWGHLLYGFCHANVFHLSLNLMALFQFKPRVRTCVIGYAASVMASFVPFASLQVPTLGLSGFIMACYARRYHAFRLRPWRIILVNILLALVPFYNWRIHLLSFFIAYIIYMVYGIVQKIGFYRRG